MKKNMSIILATLLALGASVANAQTTTPASVPLAMSDFRRDVEVAKTALQADPQALAMTQAVNAEDSEGAGDSHGTSVAVDGEEPEDQINGEIEDEIEVESRAAGTTGSSTTDMTTSEGNGSSESGN